jgi:5-dehydro-4-deoxyglucarate dehydratase
VTIGPDDLRRRIAEGVMAFPASAFSDDGGFDPTAFEAHVAELARHRPSALVPAGGAGELFSLTPAEHGEICRIGVAQAAGVPVIAGVGHGVAIATGLARAAEKAGADGLLVFPPYLIAAEQEGLLAYLTAICRAVGIGVIAYSRNNGILTPETAMRLAEACPNFIALKDGTGDFEALLALRRLAGDRLAIVNGVPTAEIIASQCFAAGIRSYSSAVFSFLPEFALGYYRAVREAKRAEVDRLLNAFYVPVTAIRGRKRGYAVSIVKAGLRLAGKGVGPVRPPLVELTRADMDELAGLIAWARADLGRRASSVATEAAE